MHIQCASTIFTFLALIPVPIAAQNATTPLNVPLNFNCSTFSAPGGGRNIRNYTAPYNQTIRVSRADICPSDADSERQRSCRVQASGTVNITATTNATDIPDTRVLQAMLHQALKLQGISSTTLNQFQTSLQRETFNGSGGWTFEIPRGTAGHVGFTPNMTCFEGVVSTNSSCSTSDEGIRNVKESFEGRALRICVPRLFGTGPAKRRSSRVAGATGLVQVSMQEAGREEMKINPANPTSKPEDHYRAAPTGSVGVGGAKGLQMQWLTLGSGLVVVGLMVGVL